MNGIRQQNQVPGAGMKSYFAGHGSMVSILLVGTPVGTCPGNQSIHQFVALASSSLGLKPAGIQEVSTALLFGAHYCLLSR